MKFTRDNVTLELVTLPNSKQKKYKVAINFKNFSRDFANMPIIDKFVSEPFYDEKEAEKVRNFILSRGSGIVNRKTLQKMWTYNKT